MLKGHIFREKAPFSRVLKFFIGSSMIEVDGGIPHWGASQTGSLSSGMREKKPPAHHWLQRYPVTMLKCGRLGRTIDFSVFRMPPPSLYSRLMDPANLPPPSPVSLSPNSSHSGTMFGAQKKTFRSPKGAAFEALRVLNLKVGRAWAMKEELRILSQVSSLEETKTFWKRWFWWATHSRLKPMRDVAHWIKRHLANVLTYITHPITNATEEGLNSKI